MRLEREPEAGFTLVETLIAIVVLIFGLIAVSNLFAVAGSQNTAANHATAAASLASEVMDRLRAVPFSALREGPLVTTTKLDLHPVFSMGSGANAALSKTFPETNCVEPSPAATNCLAGYDLIRTVPGVGLFEVKWQIIKLSNTLYYIVVRAQSVGMSAGRTRLTPIIGERSYAVFATFRTQS